MGQDRLEGTLFCLNRMENEVIEACRDVIFGDKAKAELGYNIKNSEITFGATLSYHIAKKYQGRML